MKVWHISILLLMLIILTSCAGKGNNINKLMPSDADYTSALDINTPEGLAKEASRLYMGMVNGTLDIEDGVEEIILYTSMASAKLLENNKQEFISQIKETRRYLEGIDDKVIDFEYAQTKYTDDGVVYIKRIQKHKNGKEYYFEQGFIQEDGEWKIASDNLIDVFELKTRFLFWFI